MNEEDSERLGALLQALSSEQLSALLGRRRFLSLHKLVAGGSAEEFSDLLIARYAVALDGSRLLEKPALLAALLKQIGTVALESLANRHLPSPFAQDADNALALASKSMRPGSSFARDISSALGLSEFLLEAVESRPAVESIEPYEPLFPLLDYQTEVKQKCIALIASGAKDLLIQMPTGAGKTRTAMEVIVDLVERADIFKKGDSVIWLAHTEELCEQAIESFISVWTTRGTSNAHVVRLWGGYSPPQDQLGGGLIVAGTSRIHAMRSSNQAAFKELAERATIVVVDEAHRALAPTVEAQINSLRNSPTTLLIGLSATPARRTGPSAENTALARMFGNNLVAPELGADPIHELRQRGVLSELERIELRYSDAKDLDESAGDSIANEEDDLPESVLTVLAASVDRNIAIIEALEKRVLSTGPAIVFCCSIYHAELLGAALRLRGIRAATVDCKMRRGLRRSVIHKFSSGDIDVLLNYGVLSTGFDAPNVQTVVIARPTRSMILYSQMLGRGLRGPMMGGTKSCTLIDVRDHLGRFGELNSLYLQFKPYWTAAPAYS